MSTFKLSRITSKFDRGIYKIYQFGYDENGDFVTKVDNFKDYFYYSAKHIDDILDIKQFDCRRGIQGRIHFYKDKKRNI